MLNPRLAGTLGGLALLLFGVAIGIVADRIVLSHHTPASSAENQHRMALQHLQELFELDDEQVAEIDRIFRHHQGAVIQSWMAVQPQLQSAIESVHLRMSEVLRPDQQETFREWLSEQEAHGIIVIDHEGRHEQRHEPPH